MIVNPLSLGDFVLIYGAIHFGDRGSTMVKVLCYKSEVR